MDGESCSPHSSKETIFERPLSRAPSERPPQTTTDDQENQGKQLESRIDLNSDRQQQTGNILIEQKNETNMKPMAGTVDDSEPPQPVPMASEAKKPESKRLVTRPTSLFSSQRSETLRDFHQQKKQPPVNRLTQDIDQPAQSSLSPQQLANNRANQQKFISQSLNTTTSTNSAQTALSITDSSSQVQPGAGSRRQQRRQQQQHSGDGSAGDLSCVDPQNPYPLYAPITFFYLNQTARPRSWCLAIVSNKYPNHSQHKHTQLSGAVYGDNFIFRFKLVENAHERHLHVRLFG